MSSFIVEPPSTYESPRHTIYSPTNHTQLQSPSPTTKKANLAKYGRIQLILGPMFSGKSTELLRKLRVFEYAMHKLLIVKFKGDQRYCNDDPENVDFGKLSTHQKDMRLALSVDKLTTIKEKYPEYLASSTIIGIDEGQFFDDIVEFSIEMANLGKIIIVAALDGDFRQKPFGNILQLVPHAESVIKLSSVCMSCFKESSFTRRLNSNDKRVKVIGSENLYACVCRRCLLISDEKFNAKLEENRKRGRVGQVLSEMESDSFTMNDKEIKTDQACASRKRINFGDDDIEGDKENRVIESDTDQSIKKTKISAENSINRTKNENQKKMLQQRNNQPYQTPETPEQQITEDWANREYVEEITSSIKKMSAFLNEFDMTCRHKLAVLREKLTTLERRLDFLDARLNHTEEQQIQQQEEKREQQMQLQQSQQQAGRRT